MWDTILQNTVQCIFLNFVFESLLNSFPMFFTDVYFIFYFIIIILCFSM